MSTWAGETSIDANAEPEARREGSGRREARCAGARPGLSADPPFVAGDDERRPPSFWSIVDQIGGLGALSSHLAARARFGHPPTRAETRWLEAWHGPCLACRAGSAARARALEPGGSTAAWSVVDAGLE